MTKLSLVWDHEIRCWILGSSSILSGTISTSSLESISSNVFEASKQSHNLREDVLIQLVNKGSLHDLGLLGCSCSPNGLAGRYMIVHMCRFSRTIGSGYSACARSIIVRIVVG